MTHQVLISAVAATCCAGAALAIAPVAVTPPHREPHAHSRQNDLIAHWPLAGDCRDHSGNGRHGRNHGADLQAPGHDGRPGTAARFDGRDDFIDTDGQAPIRLGTGDFTITLRAQLEELIDDVPGDLVSLYDPNARRGFVFSIKHHAGVTSSQANYRNLHFGIDNGQAEPDWTDHGRPGNAVLVFALAVHAGQLYAATCEPGTDQAGHVYRFDGANRWVDCGSPDRSNAVSALAESGGQLYAGVSKYRLGGSALPESNNPHLGGKVYRYAGESRWIDCGQLPDTEAIGAMVEYRGALYASSLYRPAGFFRYEGGQNWTTLPTPGGKRVEALTVYNGQIFASGYDEGHVYRYDGRQWTDCGPLANNTQTYSFAVHEGRLYVGTWPTGRVYRYRGDNDWEDVGRLGEELEVMGMLVHNGKLYAGTLPLADVYRYDGGSTWTSFGRVDDTADVKYRRAWSMAEYRGRLFCGTLPSGHVLSREAGRNVTHDSALAAGWHHLAAVRRSGQLELYVDGARVARSSAFDPSTFDLSADVPIRIGRGPTDYFQGSLGDVRIYGRALADSEIAAVASEPAAR